MTPEEVLYRSSGAPDRFEETDRYFAHEGLPAGALPDSDLVKAVHHYASQYYEVLALREKKTYDAEKKRARAVEKDKKKATAAKRQQTVAGKREKRKAALLEDDDDDDNNKETSDTNTDTDMTQKFIYSRRRLLDERSMDETALLAFGILLEEAGRQALGENGDLVFTEAAEEEGMKEGKEGKEKGERRVTDERHGL